MPTRFLLTAIAALALSGCWGQEKLPALSASAQAEADAITAALENVCQLYIDVKTEKKLEPYQAKLKGQDWEIDDPPGLFTFNRSGEFGRVRAAFGMDFHGGPCRITFWTPRDATTHDGQAATNAIVSWLDKVAPGTKRHKNRVQARGPAGTVESEWYGEGVYVKSREQPIGPGRAVLEIDVRRGAS